MFFDKSTIKFIFVGIINTIVGTTVMFVLYNCFHASYWFSTAMNYIIGSIVSFFLNKYFTFKSKSKSKREVFLFIANIAVCYFIAYGLAKPFAKAIFASCTEKLQTNISMLIGMCVFVGLNYLGQRFFVFRYKGDKKSTTN